VLLLSKWNQINPAICFLLKKEDNIFFWLEVRISTLLPWAFSSTKASLIPGIGFFNFWISNSSAFFNFFQEMAILKNRNARLLNNFWIQVLSWAISRLVCLYPKSAAKRLLILTIASSVSAIVPSKSKILLFGQFRVYLNLVGIVLCLHTSPYTSPVLHSAATFLVYIATLMLGNRLSHSDREISANSVREWAQHSQGARLNSATSVMRKTLVPGQTSPGRYRTCNPAL